MKDDYIPKTKAELIKKEFGFDIENLPEEALKSDYSSNTSEIKPISLEDLMSKEYPEIDWVVEQLIPAEGIITISGLPSAYKTWLVLDLAIRVARGDVFLDRFITSQTGVLIVDEETGERWIQQRMQKLLETSNLPVHLLSKAGFKLTQGAVENLISFAKSKKVGLVIFDSFLRVHTARDENSAVEMAQVFSLIQQLTKEGLTVIFTHHHRKQGILRSSNPSQDIRGSSDILAAVDCHLAVERKEDLLIIKQTKLRQGEEIKPFKVNINMEEDRLRFEYAGEIDEIQTKKSKFREAIKDILEREDEPLYKKELAETLKRAGIEGGYSTFKLTLQEMIEKGELFEKRGERNKVYCSLNPFEPEQILLKTSEDG